MIRLNKYLQEAGVCSRRAADGLIESGRVSAGGKTGQLGQMVALDADVRLDGERVVLQDKKRVVIAFNKPKGIVCTEDKDEPRNIIDYISYPERITYAGRLDKDSEGLILLTNDGALIERMMRGRYAHEKEYLVSVDGDLTDEAVDGMREGVPIEIEEKRGRSRITRTVVTRPCTVVRTGPRECRIILTQGLNRQIRKMCAYHGYKTVRLKRVRIMNITLGDLPTGSWRVLSDEEVRDIEESLKADGSPAQENTQ